MSGLLIVSMACVYSSSLEANIPATYAALNCKSTLWFAICLTVSLRNYETLERSLCSNSWSISLNWVHNGNSREINRKKPLYAAPLTLSDQITTIIDIHSNIFVRAPTRSRCFGHTYHRRGMSLIITAKSNFQKAKVVWTTGGCQGRRNTRLSRLFSLRWTRDINGRYERVFWQAYSRNYRTRIITKHQYKYRKRAEAVEAHVMEDENPFFRSKQEYRSWTEPKSIEKVELLDIPVTLLLKKHLKCCYLLLTTERTDFHARSFCQRVSRQLES